MRWHKALEQFVTGDPRSKGSFTPITTKGGRVFMKQSRASKSWENTVRQLCQDEVDACHEGPIALRVHFCLERPKGHCGTGKNAGRLKASAPEHPDKTPDIDKLLRAIMDGLTRVLYDDDKRVVRVEVTKEYQDPGGRIGVWIQGWAWR